MCGYYQIFFSQTELAIDTHVTVTKTHALVSDVHRDVGNINSTVSDVHHGVENIHVIVANIQAVIFDMHQEIQKREEGADDQNRMVRGTRVNHVAEKKYLPPSRLGTGQRSGLPMGHCLISESSISGELPPPPSRDFFGRDELIDKIVGLAEDLTPIALIGAGGIGKTSIALTILHDDRVERRFGDKRRFIRCDQFHPSPPHFLRRLSKVIGAAIENPEDLAALRPSLSSKEMIIVLDNAESILDPQGTGSQEIHDMVEELSRFRNIWLCITSRNFTVPPDCEVLEIPTLSIEAGRDTFYRICKHRERTDPVNDILEQLDFHPLSITLLATVAQYNRWDANRLAREWGGRRTGMLHTRHKKSLAATVELSLNSPTFQELGPDAQGLLEVIAFFPQGVKEDNFDWLFPTISDGIDILDTLCTLSLTYRSDGYITMLAPLRDHLCPKDPMSSPLLCIAKESYFARLSVDLDPEKPGFGGGQWITSEDANVEHLLDVFTTINANSDDVWDACISFMKHLFWHKGRLVVLRPKIGGLPDDHRSKPGCLFQLSKLFSLVGNDAECKNLSTQALKLQRERGDVRQVARTLSNLSDANRLLGLFEEGIQQAEEALEIYKHLGDTVGEAQCLNSLAYVLYFDGQLVAAEEAASRAISQLPEKGEQFLTCRCHRVLGDIYGSKGNTERAVHHFEVALGIASSFDWHEDMFWIHYRSACLSLKQGRFDDADAHVERAKSHAPGDPFRLGAATVLQALTWHQQGRLEEAKFEALCAADVAEKLGAALLLDACRKVLAVIDSSCSEQSTESE